MSDPHHDLHPDPDHDTPATPLRILTVCRHNRTRSVMMAAFLESMLTARLSDRPVVVQSSGFGPVGLPAIDDAVAAMRRRGLEVSAHRSQTTTASLVDGADVILTAERDHVVRIAALSPLAFRRAMTLPEFLTRSADVSLSGASDVRAWVEGATATRTAGAYLRDPIAEVADPTGSMARAFEAAVVTIEQQCSEVVDILARVAEP